LNDREAALHSERRLAGQVGPYSILLMTSRLLKYLAILPMIAGVVLSACTAASGSTRSSADSARNDSLARARQDSVNRAQPGYVIDSILPPEEELRRFRAAFGGDSATSLVGGSQSRDALVKRFVHAVATRDTADLLAMVIHGREFADLYYPDSPYARPPYHQPPSFAWRLIQDPSTAGLTKLLQRLGGKPMTFVAERCDPKVAREGRTTRYAGCLVTVVAAAGDTVTKRYFGSIVERGGAFKFLSYTNDF
jgi:hypothetical protein